jgi:hypothetical protein
VTKSADINSISDDGTQTKHELLFLSLSPSLSLHPLLHISYNPWQCQAPEFHIPRETADCTDPSLSRVADDLSISESALSPQDSFGNSYGGVRYQAMFKAKCRRIG